MIETAWANTPGELAEWVRKAQVLEAENAALKQQAAKYRAALEPFAKMARFTGWKLTAPYANSVVFITDDVYLTRGHFDRAYELWHEEAG